MEPNQSTGVIDTDLKINSNLKLPTSPTSNLSSNVRNAILGASTEPRVNLSVPETVPSTMLSEPADDPFARRAELEQQQLAQSSNAQGFQSTLSEIQNSLTRLKSNRTPSTADQLFSNPEGFLEQYFNRPQSDAEQKQTGILEGIANRLRGFDESQVRSDAIEQTGLINYQDSLAAIRDKKADREVRLRNDLQALENDPDRRGVAREFFEREKANIEREANRELADLAIRELAAQGNYEMAYNLVNDAVESEYSSLENEIAAAQAEIAALKPTLDGEAANRATQLEIALGERARFLKEEKQSEIEIRQLAIEAAKNGASTEEVQLIQASGSAEQALNLASPYLGRLDRLNILSTINKRVQPEAVTTNNFIGADQLIQLGVPEENISDGVRMAAQERIKTLPAAGERESATSALSTFDNAKTLIELLDDGVKTGPVVGRAKRGISAFGIPILPGTRSLNLGTDEGNEFAAASTIFTANFIKAISGAQVSDKEREFLMNALPDETKQESVNRSNIKMLSQFIANRAGATLNMDLDSLVPVDDEEVSPQNADDAYVKTLDLD